VSNPTETEQATEILMPSFAIRESMHFTPYAVRTFLAQAGSLTELTMDEELLN